MIGQPTCLNEKIFSAEQIRRWDKYSIEHEPIASIDLMERAAAACTSVIKKYASKKDNITILSGSGNNGGDGLAIARMLEHAGWNTEVILLSGKAGTQDYQANLKRYQLLKSPITVERIEDIPDLSGKILIDTLFGTGLNKPIEGFYAEVIRLVNEIDTLKLSIDIPSGLYADKSSKGNTVFKATKTLTFQVPKLAFFMPENAPFIGDLKVLDIGLSAEYRTATIAKYHTIRQISLPERTPFSHKGTYGHACILAGSYGMMGAAVLSASACLRSGVGKLTTIVCRKGYSIMQARVPEAMCQVFGENHIEDIPDLSDYDVIGVGPGIGQFESHKTLLEHIFALQKPLIVDADALNVLSQHQELLNAIPANSILTPHPKEFERLFGKTENNFEERERALTMAAKHHVYIILKGRYTFIASPEGKGYFNTTGNPGMATGGSGDVLTGILTGLLAQGFSPLDTCIIGVYLHGLAGDIAAQKVSQYGLIASDIVNNLGAAYTESIIKN